MFKKNIILLLSYCFSQATVFAPGPGAVASFSAEEEGSIEEYIVLFDAACAGNLVAVEHFFAAKFAAKSIINENFINYTFGRVLRAGQNEVAKCLLKNGARANAKIFCRGGEWTRPLHLVANRNQLELVELLLAYGADPLLTNDDGKKPVELSSDDEVKKLLLSAMTNSRENMISTLCWSIKTGDIEAVERLVNQGVEINEKDPCNATGCRALHYAAMYNRLAVVKLLLKHGADPFLTNHEGRMPIDLITSPTVTTSPIVRDFLYIAMNDPDLLKELLA